MRKFLIVTILLFVPALSFAQEKVLDRSAKKAPGWINGVERNYLIVSATAPDIEQAKEKVLLSIREQIVRSVAVKVQSTVSVQVQETMLNGQVKQFLETTGVNTLTKTGNVPYLNEISLSNANEYYWVKKQNKKTKEITVEYHVKYPFSELQLKRLVTAFQEADAALTARLDSLCDAVEAVGTTEEIAANIAELQALYKSFDDSRKDKAQNCTNAYRKLYSYISLEATAQAEGKISYTIMLNGKKITTLQKPRISSNCAGNLQLKNRSDGASITYKTPGCYADTENYIEVNYNFGGKMILQRFNFTVKESE